LAQLFICRHNKQVLFWEIITIFCRLQSNADSNQSDICPRVEMHLCQSQGCVFLAS
jgi:hypothetical protein